MKDVYKQLGKRIALAILGAFAMIGSTMIASAILQPAMGDAGLIIALIIGLFMMAIAHKFIDNIEIWR